MINGNKKLKQDFSICKMVDYSFVNLDAELYVSELINNKNSLSFGLFENNNMIGMALGHIKHWYEGTEYWIDEFGVLPEKQQCGIGTEFLTGIEKALEGKGIIYIALLTERTVPAYYFYKRNGFDEKKETSFFVKRVY